MNNSKPPLPVACVPLLAAGVLFGIAQLLTRLGCRGFEGNCGYDWLWLLLWPFFIVLFGVAVVITAVLLMTRIKR